MKIEKPIITSLLDTDLYKLTQGSVVFHDFPFVVAEYEFINRNRTPFPPGFAKALNRQVELMDTLSLSKNEIRFLNTIPYLRPTYIEWLSGYRFNPSEVSIKQEYGNLNIRIQGPWYRTILFEVPLMAIISELFFKMTNQEKSDDWKQRIEDTGNKLSNNGCRWIDFGTRRRYSYEVQDAVVNRMQMMDGFLGTSNPHLAMKHNVTPSGTYAHEYVQGISGLYGVKMANTIAMKHWAKHFNGNLGVALTDTFTTEVFLKEFTKYEASLFDGVRQDSGDPIEWGYRMLEHYKKLGIPTNNKRFVFSDALDADKYVKIANTFQPFAQPIGGIGTFLSNNVGVRPLNMVIKLKRIKKTPQSEWVNVVKLSDNEGKHTGKPEAIEQVKRELGIV